MPLMLLLLLLLLHAVKRQKKVCLCILRGEGVKKEIGKVKLILFFLNSRQEERRKENK
jgi:hypothetical protein